MRPWHLPTARKWSFVRHADSVAEQQACWSRATSKSRASFFRLLARQAPADSNHRHHRIGCDQTALSVELVMSEIDWQVEHKRFMTIAYDRTVKAAKRAFRSWHISKQEDSIACCIGKMWDQSASAGSDRVSS